MDETTMEPRIGTGVITEEETRTDERLEEGDHDRFAHYVDKSKLTEAYVMGSPVIALCKQVFKPGLSQFLLVMVVAGPSLAFVLGPSLVVVRGSAAQLPTAP